VLRLLLELLLVLLLELLLLVLLFLLLCLHGLQPHSCSVRCVFGGEFRCNANTFILLETTHPPTHPQNLM